MNNGSAAIANMANMKNSEEKEVILTGSAANALSGGGRKRKNTRKGGDNSGALLQLAAQSKGDAYQPSDPQQTSRDYAAAFQDAAKQLPLLQGLQQKGGNPGAIVNLASSRSVVTPGAPSVMPSVSGKSPEDLAPVQGGAVLLKPRKSKVSLKAPRKMHLTTTAHTRKNHTGPRKIKFGVRGLKTRLNSAKKAHMNAQSISIPIIKQRLVKAGVIKPNTKAPEHMLRTMYADLLVTKKGL